MGQDRQDGHSARHWDELHTGTKQNEQEEPEEEDNLGKPRSFTTENHVSSGVNNAVPPSVCYPMTCWFRKQPDAALSSNNGVCRDVVQRSRTLQHCGVGII